MSTVAEYSDLTKDLGTKIVGLTLKQAKELSDYLETEHGIKVLDPPAHYPEYSGDYYAVFFEDPDGMKLELVYAPGWI